MASRASLNKVLLIGNLTRDPELRYTPSGAAVCTFGLATNRTYVASDGTRKEEAEFTKIVAWNKLAELCAQLLKKGRKVYVEGRLSTHSWETPDGQMRQTTEVVIDDMRILDPRRPPEEEKVEEIAEEPAAPKEPATTESPPVPKKKAGIKEEKPSKKDTKSSKTESKPNSQPTGEESLSDVDLEDLPF